MPPPTWQQEKIWASYLKMICSERRSSCFVCRLTLKREIRGSDIFEIRRSTGRPGGSDCGLKVGKYCR